jgi:hypothetical protein
MISGLPRHCSLGVKKSSKGHLSYWRGYKLRLDVADGQIPISALLTGACLHDSQVAIPLMTLTSQRVTYLYDLMDAAYDANAIHAHSRSLGHIPLIAPNGSTAPISKLQQDSLRRYHKRRPAPTHYVRKRPPFTPAQQQRFELGTMVERSRRACFPLLSPQGSLLNANLSAPTENPLCQGLRHSVFGEFCKWVTKSVKKLSRLDTTHLPRIFTLGVYLGKLGSCA